MPFERSTQSQYELGNHSVFLHVHNRVNFNASMPNMYLLNNPNDSFHMQQGAADIILPERSKDALFFVRQYTLPVIGILGVIGNVLSAIIFINSNHRNTSCGLYLAARSIVDTVFIITLFVAWLDFIEVRIFHMNGVCQSTVFLSYVCSFMSVSLVVCITFENYVRVCKPMKVFVFCTTRIAQHVIVGLFLVALAVYNFPLWATDIQEFNGKKYCLTLQRFQSYEIALTYVDTSLTLVLPLFLIISLMLLICFSAIEASKRQRRLHRSVNGSSVRCTSTRHHSVVTKLLTSVSVIFLILHTPSHVIRIKVILESFLGNPSPATESDRHLHYVFLTMYYMNFSVNCIVYILFCRHFRLVFVSKFCCFFRKPATTNGSVRDSDQERFSNVLTLAELVPDKEGEETLIGSI